MAKVRVPGTVRNQYKSKYIFRIVQYNWIILPLVYGGLYLLAYWSMDKANGGRIPVDDSVHWTRNSILWLFMALPNKPFAIISILGSCSPMQPFQISRQPRKRSFRRMLICLVTRGDQAEVVKRSVRAAQHLCPILDDRICFHVLTEARNAHRFRGMFDSHVQVHGIPADYEAVKAKYKARGLEWFRIHVGVHDEDWVLHIDEETILDEYALQACLDFMTRQDSTDIGQGIIHYNCHGYWGHILTTIGDVERVIADWGRLQWQMNRLHHAALGVHGSFLLIKGSVENAITWETDIVTEDYWFCLQAMRQGFRMGWIPAIARELSPTSIRDYIQQRKRWCTGIRSLNQPLGNLQLFCHAWTIMGTAYWAYWIWTEQYLVPIPRWLYCVTIWELTVDRSFSALALMLQDWDADVSFVTIFAHQVMAYWLKPLINLMDLYAIFSSLVSPARGFHIISKD